MSCSRKYNNRMIYPHTPTHSQKELVDKKSIVLRIFKLYILLVIYHVNIPR